MIVSNVRNIVRSRDVLWNLTLRELRSKYRRSFLGWSWSLLNPLALVGIFGFVFGVIFGAKAPAGDPSGLTNYALYLVSGLLTWNFFSLVTNLSMGSFLGNAGLVRKVSFARETLVLSQAIFGLVQYGIEMSLLTLILLVAGSPLLPWLPMTIVMMVLLALFTTGLSLILSVVNVYFRDLNYLWTIFMQVWFYATPIVYDPSLLKGKVPEAIRYVVDWNPMALFVRTVRNGVFDARGPTAVDFVAAVGYSVAAVIAGLLVFNRLNRRLAEEI